MPTALITGGASGIGRAIVERLAASAYRVVVADINAACGEEFVTEWRHRYPERGADLHFIRTDVSSEADIASAVEHTVDAFGRIDCMINNAGIGGAFGPVTDIAVDE